MGYTVLPYSHINEATGEPEGEAVVVSRDLSLEQTQVTYQEAPESYQAPSKGSNGVIAPLDPNASDSDLINFWRSSESLSDYEINQLQESYMATDDQDLANLLAYRLTGDESHLSEQQKYELFLDSEMQEVDEPLDEVMSDEDIDQAIAFVQEAPVEVSEASQQAVLNAQLDGEAGEVIQALAYKVVSGELEVNDAMNMAADSGLPVSELYAAYHSLYTQTN